MDSLNGHVRAVYVTESSVGAGATMVNLRPDAGKIWKILACNGYQASGGARNCAWYITDPENPGGLNHSGTISLASSQRLALGAVAAAVSPLVNEALWATNGHYFTFLWTASGAAEAAVIMAEVIEYTGTGKLA